MERVVEDEWLDDDRRTPEEIDCALRAISLVNLRFGGVRLHARLLRQALARVPRETQPRILQPRILEVASGHADVLQAALRRLAIAGTLMPEITLLDRTRHHLPDPHSWPAELSPPRTVVGDALDLPFPDASVDIISCCLFVHHLEPPQVARYLAEALRVARVAVVINDLERSGLHYQLAKLNRFIDPSPISRHDGPVSVRRAYTRSELASMLAATGLSFVLERAWLCRLGAVLWCGESVVASHSLDRLGSK
ncbi:MAG TPA: methyltransferase domain-containing protein [Acidobacteriaceae bacterium]|nr:methyltransferase domain-containing protein [Acidobacteriaceae bacterium]